ncbi:MAG: ADOP family duplicated permease [Longimicrobiales bacterium]|jgi:predicted permease
MRERSEFLEGTTRMIMQAVRRLRRAPGFTLSVVSILGLGIGANAVMFGVVDRLLLSPPQHIVDSDEVQLLHVRRVIFNGDTSVEQAITWPDFVDFSDLSAFSATAGYTNPHPQTVGRGSEATPARTVGASATLFSMLGVQPVLGRFYSENEDRPGATPTAVLAEEYWVREFASDSLVVGRTLDIGPGSYTIIGVAPAGFTGVQLAPVDIWIPIQPYQTAINGDGWKTNRGWYWLQAAARLAPGATVEAASAEATAAHRGGRADMIAEDRYDEGAEIVVAPVIAARGPRPSQEAQVAQWLAGVSLVVLLIACFNVANLLLARAVHTKREIAVRLTLGISRRRLMGEFLVESLILSGLGAAAAVGVSRILGGTIHQVLLPGVAFSDVGMSGRLLLFTTVATVVAGLLTGIVPAVQATRTELAGALRSGGRDVVGGRSKTRLLFLVGQAALSVVLLVGAGLFVQSMRQAESLDLGFDSNRLIVLSLEWNETLPAEERRAVYEAVTERIHRIPGVRSAGLTYTVPFRSSISLGQPRVVGVDSIPKHHDGGPYANKVGSGYFEAMGLTIAQGRGTEASDDAEGAPLVAIVSASMAAAIWPTGSAVGACMMLGKDEAAPCTQVVGIVENHHRLKLVEEDPHFLYYLNQGHPELEGPPQALMVGANGEPSEIIDLVRQEARATSSQIRFVSADAMSDYVELEMRSWKLGAAMFTVFGALALIVAAWGLYSVLAFDVVLRSHELGVRAALGAGVPQIVRLVLRQAISLVALGTVIGLAAAAWIGGFIQPLLFETSGRDPLTYGSVAVALLLVAALAGSLPAWHATRIDPREALQSD